jgi:hypothetical protein
MIKLRWLVEFGRTCSMNRSEEMHTKFILEDLMEKENLKQPEMDRRGVLFWKTDFEDRNLIEVTAQGSKGLPS